MNGIRAALFDLDDSLVRTWEVKWAHHKAVAERFYSVTLTDEVLAEHWGMPFDVMIGILYQQAATVEEMRAANRSIEHEFLKSEQPGAREVVAGLRLAGVAVGVVTSTNRSFAEQDLSRLGFDMGGFIGVQGAEDSPVHKPDPAVFAPMLGRLAEMGIQPEEVVYVGDALMDWEAARGAGLNFVGVTTGRVSAEEFRAAGAENVIASLEELPELLGLQQERATA